MSHAQSRRKSISAYTPLAEIFLLYSPFLSSAHKTPQSLLQSSAQVQSYLKFNNKSQLSRNQTETAHIHPEANPELNRPLHLFHTPPCIVIKLGPPLITSIVLHI